MAVTVYAMKGKKKKEDETDFNFLRKEAHECRFFTR